MKTIVLTGGGSGGHIAPILAVAPELLKTKKLYWIGSSSFEENAAQDLKIEFKKIHSGKFRRYFSLKNFIDIFHVKIGFFQSLFFLRKVRPELVFSTGGFVSVPVVMAAWVFRIPIIIHEQTIGFGLANKIGAFCADKILLAFPESKKYISKKYHSKIEVVGNPIRSDILGGNLRGLQDFLLNDLEKNKPVMHNTGGGQGSRIINDTVFKSLETLLGKYYVIHQTGHTGIEESLKYKNDSYFPVDFVSGNDLSHIYYCTDIAVARAGAGTVNELNYFGIYSIFVPLQPVQNDEQMKNAEWFLKSNQGEIIKQNNFNKNSLMKAINNKKPSGLYRLKKSNYKENNSTNKILDFLNK